MNISSIENALSKELPHEYKNLVDDIEDFAYIVYNENSEDFPDDEGTAWFFWGISRLFEETNIDGASQRPAWQQLASYAEIDQKHRNRTSVPANGNNISFAHLENSVAIAEDNGDILYIDTISNNSIWIYMHASGEVKLIANNFHDWLEKAIIEH